MFKFQVLYFFFLKLPFSSSKIFSITLLIYCLLSQYKIVFIHLNIYFNGCFKIFGNSRVGFAFFSLENDLFFCLFESWVILDDVPDIVWMYTSYEFYYVPRKVTYYFFNIQLKLGWTQPQNCLPCRRKQLSFYWVLLALPVHTQVSGQPKIWAVYI